jgi:hypothetical protein
MQILLNINGPYSVEEILLSLTVCRERTETVRRKATKPQLETLISRQNSYLYYGHKVFKHAFIMNQMRVG